MTNGAPIIVPPSYEELAEAAADGIALRMRARSWQLILAAGVILGMMISWGLITWQIADLRWGMNRRFTALENRIARTHPTKEVLLP